MEKAALPVPHVVALILGLLVILGLGYLFLGPGKDMVIGLLKSWGLVEQRDFTTIEKAIRCSYYRCKEGCKSSNIADLEFQTTPLNVNGGTFVNCKTEFCDKVPIEFKEGDRKDKVCDEHAHQYPVSVYLEFDSGLETKEISKEILGMNLNGILSDSSTKTFNWGDILVADSAIGIDIWTNWVTVLDRNLETENRVKVSLGPGNIEIDRALDKLTMYGQGYYIYSGWRKAFDGGLELTVVNDTAPYRYYYCCKDAAGNPTATCSDNCQNGYYLGPSTASNCGGYCSATPCTGNVALGLSPNPVERGQTVTASISINLCSGRTAYISPNSCTFTPVTSCTVSGSSCSKTFIPTAIGTFTYYGCIDKNSDNDYLDAGESSSSPLVVSRPI